MPTSCPDIPSKILDPKSTWESPDKYDQMANELARKFTSNFKQFESEAKRNT